MTDNITKDNLIVEYNKAEPINTPTPLVTTDILLVEDNMSEAILIIRALKKNNPALQIIHVKDGVEAVDFLFARGNFVNRQDKKSPMLIIMDLKMPRMDGHDVLRIIKIDEKLKLIPVVMMTTSKDENDILTSYTLGANSYIIKPLEIEALNKAATLLGDYWFQLNEQTTYSN